MYREKKIAVVVVLYNGKSWIEKCFGSLTKSNIKTEIIAIDNNSVDGSAELLQELFPDVKLLKAGENLGFGKANNIGIRMALSEKAEYVFLLNQDAWVEKDTFEKLLQIHNEKPIFGILSPIHLNGSGKKMDENFAQYMNSVNTPNFLSDLFLGKQKQVYSTSFVNAAAWLISRECIERVGGFDPIFPHYGEDSDLISRVIKHGFHVGVVLGSIIYHDRVCKSLNSQKKDLKRVMISDTLKLKTPSSPFRSNLLVYVKDKFDNITSLLLYRRFEEAGIQFKSFYKTMFRIKSIYNSCIHSNKVKAFLE